MKVEKVQLFSGWLVKNNLEGEQILSQTLHTNQLLKS